MAFLTHKPHDSPIHSFSRSFIDDERTADRKRVTAQGLGLGGEWRWTGLDGVGGGRRLREGVTSPAITNNLKLGHKMLHSDWVIKPFKRREKMLPTIGKTKQKYTEGKIK